MSSVSAAITPLDAAAELSAVRAGEDYVYADAPNRLVAFLLDAVLLSALVFVCAAVLSAVVGPAVEIDLGAEERVTLDTSLLAVDGFVATAVSALFFLGGWLLFAGTPGQRLLGLRVVGRDGRRLRLGQAAVRWLLVGAPPALAGLVMLALGGTADSLVYLAVWVWYLALFVSLARSPMKRGLHDRAAGSVVVKAARPATWRDSEGRERAG